MHPEGKHELPVPDIVAASVLAQVFGDGQGDKTEMLCEMLF